MSDEELAAGVAGGDPRCFDAIVDRHRGPLLRHCRRMLPHAHAEDAVQQALANAYVALSTGGAPRSLRPWLYRVAQNAALDIARDRQFALDELHDTLPAHDRPEIALQRHESLRDVVGAVRALPEVQRDVIVRHSLDGHSHKRIAADLGLTAGAVRQLAYRARTAMRAAGVAALAPLSLVRRLLSGAGPGGGGDAATGAASAGVGGALTKTGAVLLTAGALTGGAVTGVGGPETRVPEGQGGSSAAVAAAAVPDLAARSDGGPADDPLSERRQARSRAGRGDATPDEARRASGSGRRSSNGAGSGSSASEDDDERLERDEVEIGEEEAWGDEAGRSGGGDGVDAADAVPDGSDNPGAESPGADGHDQPEPVPGPPLASTAATDEAEADEIETEAETTDDA